MTATSGTVTTTNESSVGGVLKLLLASAGLVGLVYLGVRMGNIESEIVANKAAIAEHESRATADHRSLDERSAERVRAAQDVLIVELRALNARLDRIDRKLP